MPEHGWILIEVAGGFVANGLFTAYLFGRIAKEHQIMWDWFKENHINGTKKVHNG